MMSLDKSRSCNLSRLALATDRNKQVTLTSRQLVEYVLIGFFILVDDLLYSFVNVTDDNAVFGRKELVEYLLKIPRCTVKTIIDSLDYIIGYLFIDVFEGSILLFQKVCLPLH